MNVMPIACIYFCFVQDMKFKLLTTPIIKHQNVLDFLNFKTLILQNFKMLRSISQIHHKSNENSNMNNWKYISHVGLSYSECTVIEIFCNNILCPQLFPFILIAVIPTLYT